MKTGTILRWASLALVLALAPAWTAAAGEGVYEMVLTEDSKFWIEGDSTLHDFDSVAEVINFDTRVDVTGQVASAVGPASLLPIKDLGARISHLVLTVPVEDMKSHVMGLSGRMHKELKYKKHPNIIFKLVDYRVAKDPASEELFDISVNGDLALAGVTNRVDVTMKGDIEKDYLYVEGEKMVLMSDYGIKPPTMFFGRVKTDDEIYVKWELQIKLTPKAGGDEPMHE